MTTPETIKTDNGKGFLSQTFAELLDKLEEDGGSTTILIRHDGEAAALLTKDPGMIKAVKNFVERTSQQREEVDHEEA